MILLRCPSGNCHLLRGVLVCRSAEEVRLDRWCFYPGYFLPNDRICANCSNTSHSRKHLFLCHHLRLPDDGTLKTLNSPEKELLKESYGIRDFTFMPSVYGPNQLAFFPDNPECVLIEIWRCDLRHFLFCSPRCFLLTVGVTTPNQVNTFSMWLTLSPNWVICIWTK